MMYDIVIVNGQIVTETNVFTGNIGIVGHKIETITSEVITGKEVIDAKNCLVMAGVIDSHVHFNDPGREKWEGWQTGTQAAASGGTTCVIDMPINSLPALTSADEFERKLEKAEKTASVDFVFWGGIENNNISHIQEMKEKGIVGYKSFMSNSGVEFTVAHDAIVYESLGRTANTNCFVAVHAENDSMTKFYTEQLKASGRTDCEAYLESRPEITELEAINRFLFLTEHTNGNGHLCHVTVAKGFDFVTQAKRKGVHITAETCANYLWFDEKDFLEKGRLLKCAPPIRSSENREKLWEKVMRGEVDMVSSDHSPCSAEEKFGGDGSIWSAWGGISGVQNLLHVMMTEGYKRRGVPLTLITKLLSVNPAKKFGIYGSKGAIEIGFDADIVIVDPEEKWQFTEQDIYTKHKISPYIGESFIGKVKRTLVRGKTVFCHDERISCDGYGTYVYAKEN